MNERDWNGGESRDWNNKDSGAGWNTAADEKAIGTIDHYELLRELGTGGFGSVYLARDTVSRTFVAVKGLPQQVNDSAGELERIRANYALVSKLKHPNVAAVLALHRVGAVACGDSEVLRKLNVKSGDTLLVMDYAPGVTLDAWCRQFPDRKVPVDQAIEVTRQIAAALDVAHKIKIVHRDVKPQNVMVETLSDGTLTARVLDFGLAAEVRSSMRRASKVGAEDEKGKGDSSGTLQYMAPEQLGGHRASAAMDQYALAALFYELVTGDVPFSSVFECRDKGIIVNVVTTKQPEIPAELPRHVRKALARALAKKPEDRFASCGDFVAALQGIVQIRWGLVAGILAAVAVAGAGGWWWQSGGAVAPRPPQPVPAAPTAEQIRAQELAAENAVYDLMRDMESAKKKIAAESEEVRSFFATEIRAFEKKFESAKEAKKDSRLVLATNFLAQAKAQADELRKLVDARKDSLAARQCALDAQKTADAVEAKTALSSRYGEAEKLFAGGDGNAQKRDFAQAKSAYASAAQNFAALRSEVIKVTLDQAKRHKDAERWQECLAAAEKVLGWETENVEAGNFKRIAHVRQLEIAAKEQLAKENWDELEKTLKTLVAVDADNTVASKCRRKLEDSRIRDDKDLCRRLQALCEIRPGDDYAVKCAKKRIRKFDFADLTHYEKHENLLADAIMVGGGLKAVRYLVEQRGFSPDEAYGYNKQTPLFAAVEKDDIEAVKYLLARGADVNRKEGYAGRIPLSYVKSVAVAEVLVAAGAKTDVTMQYQSDKKPFTIADNKGYRLTQWLCDKGCRLTDVRQLYRKAAGAGDLAFLKEHVAEVKGIPDLILSAVGGNRPDVIVWLESQGQSLAYVSEDGWTAAHSCGSTNMTLALYRQIYEKSGLSATVKDKRGNTPLHMAWNADIMRFLLDKGADVSARDANGQTPLMRACSRCNAEQVALLLAHGADVNVHDKNGRSVLEFALAEDCYPVAKALIDKGADINALKEPGHGWRTLLTRAAYGGDVKQVKFLVENGADPVAVYREEDGREVYPLDGAFYKKNREMFRLLVAHGADPYRMDSKGGNMFRLYNEEGKAFARFVLEETGVKKGDGSYIVSSAVQLKVVLELCEKNTTISVRNGDYRLLKEVDIRKSIILQGESREKTILGSIDIYAADGGGDIDCKILSLSVLPRQGKGIEVHGYKNDITIEIENCEIKSDDRALETSWDVRHLAVRECKLSGSEEYGAVYINDAKDGKTLDVEISDSEIRGVQCPAINFGGERSRVCCEDCKFVGGVGADAAVECRNDPCLFNTCSFSGGQMCVKYASKSKFYNCTFSGKESDSELKKVYHKLTEKEFD